MRSEIISLIKVLLDKCELVFKWVINEFILVILVSFLLFKGSFIYLTVIIILLISAIIILKRMRVLTENKYKKKEWINKNI